MLYSLAREMRVSLPAKSPSHCKLTGGKVDLKHSRDIPTRPELTDRTRMAEMSRLAHRYSTQLHFFNLKRLYLHSHKCASSAYCLRLHHYWKTTQNKRLMKETRREGLSSAEREMFRGGVRSALHALLLEELRAPS